MLNDSLRSGFVNPNEGSVLIWRHSAIWRERAGYGETLRLLEDRLGHCHRSDVPEIPNDVLLKRNEERQSGVL